VCVCVCVCVYTEYVPVKLQVNIDGSLLHVVISPAFQGGGTQLIKVFKDDS
jgi:hypothetical protein